MVSSMVELISNKNIKPFSETPPSLKHFKLSSVDQLLDNVYVPLAFYFPGQENNGRSRTEISTLLEKSLSKTLSYYYPFAGRLSTDDHNDFIDCNDKGVLFLEVQMKSTMMESIGYPNAENLVFSQCLPWGMSSEGHLAVFQLSYFDCGGIAISVCISHKVADASTMATFMNDWASMFRQPDFKPSPHFVGTSIFLPVDNLPGPADSSKIRNCATRLLVFNASKIAQLKAIAAEAGVEKPTRVEVVAALLLKRLMFVAGERLGSFRPSVLFQVFNLRPLMIPPLHENSVGNLCSNFFISVTEENEMEFARLVNQLRNEKVKVKNQCKEELEANNLTLDMNAIIKDRAKAYSNDRFDLYNCSSLCGFPLYEIDFGWGRPLRVYIASYPVKNTIFLMDNPSGDGIEAFVTLEGQFMSMFECDAELFDFASSTPNAKRTFSFDKHS